MIETIAELNADKLVLPSIIPSGEWHRTEENIAILTDLMQRVFAPDNILVAHHLCFSKDGKSYEIASVETWIFDPVTLKCLFGDDAWAEVATFLVLVPPTQRLQQIKYLLANPQIVTLMAKPVA